MLAQRRGRVLVAHPHGFCAGVERAIRTVELALERYGPPVYVRGEIVHSDLVVRDLSERGAIFVASEAEVPEGEVCVLSAHGVTPAVRKRAAARGLRVIDATCPLVAKVHVEVRRYIRAGRTVVLIGRRGHDEVEGTVGEAPPEQIFVVADLAEIDALPIAPGAPVAYVMQTTLAVDDTLPLVARLRERFSDLVGPGKDDICYASQNRQAAVKAIAGDSDIVLVAGARNSANSNRLVEVAEAQGKRAHLVPSGSAVEASWLEGAGVVGLGAGASAPQGLVDAILERLGDLGYDDVTSRTVTEERVRFPDPRWPA